MIYIQHSQQNVFLIFSIILISFFCFIKKNSLLNNLVWWLFLYYIYCDDVCLACSFGTWKNLQYKSFFSSVDNRSFSHTCRHVDCVYMIYDACLLLYNSTYLHMMCYVQKSSNITITTM